MDSQSVLEIHTSDRQTFKRCRQLWDFRSPIRRNLEPIDEHRYFSFGRSIHKGLEVWYNPEYWTDDGNIGLWLEDDAITAFYANENKAFQDRVKALLPYEMPEEETQEWKDRSKLGEGMLRHYFKYSVANDFGVWVPLLVEVPFTIELWPGVTYNGRIDAVFKKIIDNTLWVWDHKTAANIEYGYHAPFEIDPQVGSYAWAMWTLGHDIRGFLFNELAKMVPEVPEPMVRRRKGLLFSVNKQQATTGLLYREALRYAGEPQEPYEAILRHLDNRQDPFFRRTEIERNQSELQQIGSHVMNEALDMVGQTDWEDPRPFIYPNPTRDNCHGCKFRTPCLVVQEGGDIEYALHNTGQYREKRED